MDRNCKITALEVQKKNSNRVSVFLDGEFSFGLHQDVLVQTGIAKGDELTQERIDEILTLEQQKLAKEKAFRLLTVRGRSKKEMSDRLRLAKFSTHIVEKTIAELERLGLINDTLFAESFARNRTTIRPEGAFLLRQELRQKGLSEEDIEKGVEAAFQDRGEQQIAYELASKRKKGLISLAEEKAKKRLNDYLLRRGFNWELVKDILEKWDQL